MGFKQATATKKVCVHIGLPCTGQGDVSEVCAHSGVFVGFGLALLM